jgi:hypothetical protein
MSIVRAAADMCLFVRVCLCRYRSLALSLSLSLSLSVCMYIRIYIYIHIFHTHTQLLEAGGGELMCRMLYTSPCFVQAAVVQLLRRGETQILQILKIQCPSIFTMSKSVFRVPFSYLFFL